MFILLSTRLRVPDAALLIHQLLKQPRCVCPCYVSLIVVSILLCHLCCVAQVRAWKRLFAKYDRDLDLFLIELFKGPLLLLWSLLTCKSARRLGRTRPPSLPRSLARLLAHP